MERRKFSQWPVWLFLVLGGAILGKFLPSELPSPASALTVEPAQQKPFAKPPEGQSFVGFKECAACHLDNYLTWKASKHPRGFDILPEKYRADLSCLHCHATGHGDPNGFVSQKETPNLAAVACEACHGPGSAHVAAAKKLVKNKLTASEKAFVRSTIYKVQPHNVCADCHLAEAHGKHPPYDK
jgi:hypothetical protein